MDNIGIFCDETLTDYEKTMYGMAIAFSHSGIYTIKNDEDISEIAAILCLNDNLLRKALNLCPSGYFPCKMIKMGGELFPCDMFENADLFDALVRVYFIYKNLSQISDGTTDESILLNFHLFQDSIGEFATLNMITSTFECIKNDCYSSSYAVFSNGCYQPKEQLHLLHMALTKDYDRVLGKNFIPFLCRVMSYELITRVNSIYLITITQVIKYSAFFSDKIRIIAEEMYYYLLGLAQNARIISIQTNYIPPLHSATPEYRGRHDNTTRLQILYGYENFDAYYLRLDLAHKGQGFIHYNNKSPGGVKCCLFSQKEYLSILSETPAAKKFFVDYDGRYALKEPHNLELLEDEFSLYEFIRQQKEHSQAFANTYDEITVVEFINIIASMLPVSCRVRMDVDEEHAQYCFQYEKIMFYSVLLEIAILSRNETQQKQALERIASLAVKSGLISASLEHEYMCIEGVCLIIDEAKSKIALYQNL